MLPFSIGSWEGFWIIFEQNLKESMEQTIEVQGQEFPSNKKPKYKEPEWEHIWPTWGAAWRAQCVEREGGRN